MMKIVALCITGSIMCLFLRQSGRGEMALMVALSVTVYAFFISFSEVARIIESLASLASETKLDSGIYKAVIKITGIAYITQAASELCKDAGEIAMAGKVELCGKILICVTAMPMVTELFYVIADIL